MTLRTLAQALGVSLQQLLKYESGKDTIAASRLYMTAVVLGVGIEALTDGIDPATDQAWPAGASAVAMTQAQQAEGARRISARGQASHPSPVAAGADPAL